MTQPPPTRLHIDPPIEQWKVTPRNGRTSPVIATGHQPTLWHPGILAKDVAADALAKHVGGSALHVVVEHNALDPLSIDVPTQDGQHLGVRSVLLDDRPGARELPPNRLPPLDASRVAQQLGQDIVHGLPFVQSGLGRVAQAYADANDAPHLSAQTTAVLHALRRPYLNAPIATRSTGEIVTPGFVDRLLADPISCARAYNRAALAYPEAGIRTLYLGRDAVEAPLWAQSEAGPTPVYIDLGDSRHPQLFTQGQDLDLTGEDAIRYLRPRAITLSAMMRSELCDLFIHGTGGGVYDQVTERWWGDWIGEDLAPKVVVSADVYMPFDVPVSSHEEHAKAQWFAHHVQHNVDRYTQVDQALKQEKQGLLDRMNDDRDKRRRAKAFKRIHSINAELCQQNAELIRHANQANESARIGLTNASIANRRDWCFALYPEVQLQDLRQQISSRLSASPE